MLTTVKCGTSDVVASKFLLPAINVNYLKEPTCPNLCLLINVNLKQNNFKFPIKKTDKYVDIVLIELPFLSTITISKTIYEVSKSKNKIKLKVADAAVSSYFNLF